MSSIYLVVIVIFLPSSLIELFLDGTAEDSWDPVGEVFAVSLTLESLLLGGELFNWISGPCFDNGEGGAADSIGRMGCQILSCEYVR
jgi:hypothetical protein